MRWTVPGLLVVGAALWVDALVGGGLIGSPIPLMVVAALAVLVGWTVRWPWALLGTAAGSVMLLAVADQVYEPGRFSLASDGLFYAVVVAAPLLVGRLLAGQQRQRRELAARRLELDGRQMLSLRVARAAERELVRDEVDQRLAGFFADLSALAMAALDCLADAPGELATTLDQVETIARDALAGLRELLGVITTRQPVELGDVDSAYAVNVIGEPTRPVLRSRWRPDRVDGLLILAAVPLAIETTLPGHHGPAVLNVLAALLQGLALTVVRRRPAPGTVLLLAVATVQTAALAALPPTVSWLLPGLLTAFLLGGASTSRYQVGGLVSMLAGVVLLVVVTPPSRRDLAGLAPGLVMGMVSWTAGFLVAAQTRRTRELGRITARLEQAQADEARLAALEQRAELTRDLHDVAAHALTVVCLQAGAAQSWHGRDEIRVRAAVHALVEITTGPLADASRSLGTLGSQPLADDAVAPGGWVEMGRRLGLRVQLDVDALTAGPVSGRSARVLHLVTREALTNAARYAGPTTVTVRVDRRAGMLELRIIDEGPEQVSMRVGAAVGAGLGLQGARQRVAAIGGELSSGANGHGFEVVARVPA